MSVPVGETIMKNICHILCLFVFALTACTSAQTGTPTLDATASRSIPSLIATSSPGAVPSQTPYLTQTPTPLPTVPTFTPTFDVRLIVTVTPAPKAACPQEDPTVAIDTPEIYQQADLDASIRLANERGDLLLGLLNRGLKLSSLLAELNSKRFKYDNEDLTGDGVKDILLSDLGRIHIFYCDNGRYKLFTEDNFYDITFAPAFTIMDLNKNGLPEIILPNGVSGKRGGLDYRIEEWNGKEFKDRALNPTSQTDAGISGPRNFELKDVNHDGLKDLVFTGEGPWDEDLLSRVKTVVYTWNGRFYQETYVSFAKRQYRFQAIQDADRELLYGNNEKAFSLYQEAIFNDQLEWWSRERKQYMVDTNASQYDPTPTVYSTPIPDLTEYPRLAAYATYRMVMLHVHLGEMDKAQTQYAALQEKFPVGSPGHLYVEMVSQFWDAYQSSGKIYNACAAAIAFADAHPEILTPLGSDYHGWQSRTYTPADVCPFR